MKIICFADRRPRGGIAKWLEDHPDADLIITLGDLEWFDLRRLWGSQLPKFGVHGNHDGDEDEFIDAGILNLHERTECFGGYIFGGLEGCPRYKRGPYQYTEAEAQVSLAKIQDAEIILSHTPPRGVHDSEIYNDEHHRGGLSLREHVLHYKPKLVLHGHTYPNRRETKLGETIVHYVNGVSVIRWDGHQVELLDTDLKLDLLA
jgi:Icc-related predicted phosphoesterase